MSDLSDKNFDRACDLIDRIVKERDELVKALEQAAARFNLMGGVGLVNGADPKVAYRECMDVLSRVKGALDHG